MGGSPPELLYSSRFAADAADTAAAPALTESRSDRPAARPRLTTSSGGTSVCASWSPWEETRCFAAARR